MKLTQWIPPSYSAPPPASSARSRQSSGPLPLQRVDGDDLHLADRAAADDLAQRLQQRLVEVVLRHEDTPPRLGLHALDLVEVRGPQEGRLLDDHVLPLRSAASVSVRWEAGGVATSTRSILGSSSAAS
jgi:hypothetical protein